MDVTAPITLAVAGYRSPARAAVDYDAVWRARDEPPFHHRCVAVVLQDRAGHSRIERSDNTAGCLAWGDAVLGAALSVLLPRVGAGSPVIGNRDGQDAFIRHFRRHIDVTDLVSGALLLDDSSVGLVVVLLNRRPADVLPLLSHAREAQATATQWADLERDLGQDLVRGVAERVPALT